MANHIESYVGNDENGNAVKFCLTKAPHVLIGGTTGSGKSSLINLLLAPLVGRMGPNSLHIYLGDAKKVEFAAYKNAPQVKYIAKTAAEHDYMLQHLCQIMDERFTWMEQRGVKNIIDQSFWPNIVVFIDEMGDVVLDKCCGKRISNSIIKLVRLGRAAGITMILATQNPVCQVINTEIKANCPTRMALKVSTEVNSRVIIDKEGAESLDGNGQMFFMSPYNKGLTKVQSPLVTDEAIRKVVDNAISKYGTVVRNQSRATV